MCRIDKYRAIQGKSLREGDRFFASEAQTGWPELERIVKDGKDAWADGSEMEFPGLDAYDIVYILDKD